MLHFSKIFIEATQISRITRTKYVKRRAMAGRNTINLARKMNAGEYKRYKMYRQRFMREKQLLRQRYGGRAYAMARRQIR